MGTATPVVTLFGGPFFHLRDLAPELSEQHGRSGFLYLVSIFHWATYGEAGTAFGTHWRYKRDG